MSHIRQNCPSCHRLLELPRLGCVNVHASLLPRHRGAAPIQAAIAAGDPAGDDPDGTGVHQLHLLAYVDGLRLDGAGPSQRQNAQEE